MFGFSPKLPISDEQRMWVDEGFKRLEKLLGRRRMTEAKVVEPTAEDFPDTYDKTPQAVESLFARVCAHMRVDRDSIELEIFQDETEELKDIVPHWRSRGDGGTQAAGLCMRATEEDRATDSDDGRMIVALRSTLLKDPMALVATAAHEIGHVILLSGNLMSAKTRDHELMTDLLTVFLGLGIFTANSAGQFKQHQTDRKIGWSMQRLGYLPQEVFAYALAKFALERSDDKTEWAKHLSTNVRADFKRSRRWLLENPHHVTMAKPIG